MPITRWGCYILFKTGMNPASFMLYIAFTYDHAFDFIERAKFPRRSRQYVKRLGSKHRWYTYDEQFADAQRALEQEHKPDELDPDEYYKEPNADESAVLYLTSPDKSGARKTVFKSPHKHPF